MLTLLLASMLTLTFNIELVYAVPVSPYIAVAPEKTLDPTITVGMNYTISIHTDYAESDVWAWQFSLTFNPAVLEGVEVRNGDLITTVKDPSATFIAGKFDNNAGYLSLTVAFFFYISPPPPTTSGPGTLAHVTFRVKSYGTSNITLGSKTKLEGDSAGNYYHIIDAESQPDHIGHGYFKNIVGPEPEPRTWTVDDDGPADFHKIQEAINAANLGDTIYVKKGTYYERLIVGRKVLLIGEDRSTTIIDGNGAGTVVQVEATVFPSVSISGFTIRNSGFGASGLYVGSSGNNVSHNIVTNNYYGISLYYSHNNALIGNIVSFNKDIGILLSDSDNNTLAYNNVSSNGDRGIWLSGSNNNILSSNIFSLNGEGIILGSSSNNSLSGNEASSNKAVNFDVSGDYLEHFMNYVDASNTVDGKSIYYLIGVTNAVIDAQRNAGTIYLINCNNITIKDAILTKNGNGVFLWNTINSRMENLTVSNNTWGIQLIYSSSNILTGSTVSSNYHRGIWLRDSSNNVLSGNRVSNNKVGIVVDQSCNNTFTGNSILDNLLGGGILLVSHSNNNVLAGNNVSNNGLGGIQLYFSYNNALTDNTIINNGRGIGLIKSSNNSISKNNITNNVYGIFLQISSNNSMSGNNIKSIDYGICLFLSHNNSLSRNYITNNWVGVDLSQSSNNSVSGNNITSNNYCGIRLHGSSDNIIYHNNFINNTKQVSTYNSTNVWDDGYPSGGNYWSDYAGVDLFSGPYQNETGSDGIGDVGYTVDENNQDSYPLMGMFYDFTYWGGMTAICNSTIHDFRWGYAIVNITTGELEKEIFFIALGPKDTVGFCRIMIPRAFMQGPYTVVSNQVVNVNELPISNTTHAFLYFTYKHPALVIIKELAPTPTAVKATVDIDPDTLNLKSKGKWITAYIELPDGYNVSDIDFSNIMLNDTILAEPRRIAFGDYDSDGVPDLMVKFNREELASYICHLQEMKFGNVTLTITGNLTDGTLFKGSDTIRVLFEGNFDGDAQVGPNDLTMFKAYYGKHSKDPLYNPFADLDTDGYVGPVDLSIFGANYGKHI